MIKGDKKMSDNKFPNVDGEENTTAYGGAEPETEENPAAEEAESAAEETFTDETVFGEDSQKAAEETNPDEAEVETTSTFDFEVPTPAKKSNTGKIAVIVVIIVAVLAAIGYFVYEYLTRNPYNEMGYINISGRTIKDVAEQSGFASVDEFLAEYSLPADMPEDTEESAAYYNIPTGKIAEMYGMELADLKEILGLGDDVDENTPWGEAEGKATLGNYIGEENLESFKQTYELGDEVTADTLWGEVRNIVDQKSLEQQAALNEENAADPDAEAVGDDAPVSGESTDGAESGAESDSADADDTAAE